MHFDTYLDIFYRYVFTKNIVVFNNKEGFERWFSQIKACTYYSLSVLKSTVFKKRRQVAELPKNWIFYETFNNYKTLSFLVEGLKESGLVTYGKGKFRTNNSINLDEIEDKKASFGALMFIFFLMLRKDTTSLNYNLVLSYFDLYSSFQRILKRENPDHIFISNDHNPVSRSLIIAARNNNIKVVYLQHACISKAFPPIRSQINFLYGVSQRDLYRQIQDFDWDQNIYLLGNPSFELNRADLNTSNRIRAIGIAFNFFDESQEIEKLINALVERYPDKEVITRRHPRDQRRLNLPDTVSISIPEKESVKDCLKRIDFMISGDSSILLEAALLNIKTVSFSMSTENEFHDHYEFVKNGLTERIVDINKLFDYIDEGRSSDLLYRNACKAYDGSIESNFEFKVRQEVLKVLSKDFNVEIIRRNNAPSE